MKNTIEHQVGLFRFLAESIDIRYGQEVFLEGILIG